MNATTPPEDRVSADVRAAAANMRETAKWILTILAGVGAVLTAGVQLSNIGQLAYTDWRLKVAVGAGLLTLLSIGVAIRKAVRVLTVEDVTLKSLVRDEQSTSLRTKGSRTDIDKATEAGFLPAPRYSSVEDFSSKYDDADETKWLELDQLIAGVLYYRVRRRFNAAVWWLLVMGFLAALGIIVFAWATNPPEPASEPSPFRTPAEASVVLTEAGKDSLGSSLGDECVEVPVRVLVLSASEARADVISIPTGGCAVARFTIVEGANGSLRPVDAVRLPREG